MKDLRFGDIYTNGINYWMVTGVSAKHCDCACHAYEIDHELRPVVMSAEGKPLYFVGYYDKQLKDIKPSVKLFARAVWANGD